MSGRNAFRFAVCSLRSRPKHPRYIIMKIRVGFELVYEFAQSTPMVLMLNVHPSRTCDLLKPDQLQVSPLVPVTRYLDAFGNICRRLIAPGRADRNFHRRDRGRFRVCPMRSILRPASMRSSELPHDALVYPPGQPLLRDRAPDEPRLVAFRQDARRLGARAGDLRLRALPRALRLSARARDAHRDGRVRRAARRVPRLRASRGHAVPLHEHPGALLHRLSRRHRRAAGARADGFQRLVRGLSRRPLVHVRRAPQRAAHRPHRDGARPRRRRRGVQHDVRSRTRSSGSPWSPTRS